MRRFVVNSCCCIALFLGKVVPSEGQIQRDTCSDRFEIAEDLYEDGKLRAAIETLEPCFNLPSERRKDIFSLSAAAYKFLDLEENAETQLLRLFNQDPFYRLDQRIPELLYMESDLVIYPKTIFTIKGGFYLFNRPVVRKRNTLEGVRILSEEFGLQNGDPLGTKFEMTLGRRLLQKGPYFHTGLGLSRFSFGYSATYANVLNAAGVVDQASIYFREKHWWVHVPAYFRFYLLEDQSTFREGVFSFYVQSGISLDFLSRRSAEWTAAEIAYSQIDDGVAIEKGPYDLRTVRNPFNVSLLLDVGFKGRSGIHAFFVEFNYLQMLGNLARYDNNPELYTQIQTELNYGGFDFTLSNLALMLGYSRLFYRAEKKRF